MGLLALYDTVSVQRYIFQSNRLRDNRGASMLARDCFSKVLPEVIERLHRKGLLKNIEIEWADENGEKTKENSIQKDMDCALIYAGGGNALLYYGKEEFYKKVNTEFSFALLRKMPGLQVVTEYLDIEGDNFGKDVDTLFKKLQIKKQRGVKRTEVPCFSVTRTCFYTEKPASGKGTDGRWVAEEVLRKQERSKQDIQQDILYKELSNMAGPEGEQWIAVIHADGNAMGENIRRLLRNSNYATGIQLIRNFSKQIQILYDQAYQETLKICGELILKSKDNRLAMYRTDQYALKPPFRKIYGAGDDFTFVCNGLIAFPAAELFLKNLQKIKSKMNFSDQIFISACAGIAFIKPGFPFFKAYEMAESCCQNAKVRAREHITEEKMGNWLDFQVIRGELAPLSEVRRSQYQVRGCKGKNISLCSRPYLVCQDGEIGMEERKYQLDCFYNILRVLHKGEAASRAKWKGLRNAFFKSYAEVEEKLAEIQRRYQKELGKIGNILSLYYGGTIPDYIAAAEDQPVAVLWDALEMLDFFVDYKGEITDD